MVSSRGPSAPSQANRPIGSLQGFMYSALSANTEATLSPDRDYLLKELKFYANAASFEAATIKVTIGNQALFNGNAIPIGLLQSEFNNGADMQADDVVITFRLPQTVWVSRNMPIKLECSVAGYVLAICIDPSAL